MKAGEASFIHRRHLWGGRPTGLAHNGISPDLAASHQGQRGGRVDPALQMDIASNEVLNCLAAAPIGNKLEMRASSILEVDARKVRQAARTGRPRQGLARGSLEPINQSLQVRCGY